MLRILIDVTHPAHVHFFKHAARIWQAHGHRVKFVARDKEITLALLEELQIPHQVLSKIRKGLLGLSIELVEHQSKLIKIAKTFKPDVMLNIGGTFIVHAGKLLGIKSCVFTDTEHAKLANTLTFPFATWICTPECFWGDLGEKQVRYEGYQELAYLHPSYFKPDPHVLTEHGLGRDERFFILRFISWGASHDVGQLGLSDGAKIKLVQKLSEYGRVIITSEKQLPDALEPYHLKVSPAKIHDLLSFASLYIGEGATMAAEAAILGTPSFYINPLTAGTIDELEKKYHLIVKDFPSDQLMETILQFIYSSEKREAFSIHHQQMLNEKIDVTAWLVDFIETMNVN